MEQFPIYEFLLDYDLPFTIYNRGIGGYTSQELLDSMEVCVYELEPKAVFLNIGTNDLNAENFTLSVMLDTYEKILQDIVKRLPRIRLYLLAFYPVNPGAGNNPYAGEVFRHRSNERIREANQGIAELAKRYNAVYLDLNENLTDEEGQLRAEFTVDGVHMYADGYHAVLRQLQQTLSKITG